jgi:hypothetical protein
MLNNLGRVEVHPNGTVIKEEALTGGNEWHDDGSQREGRHLLWWGSTGPRRCQGHAALHGRQRAQAGGGSHREGWLVVGVATSSGGAGGQMAMSMAPRATCSWGTRGIAVTHLRENMPTRGQTNGMRSPFYRHVLTGTKRWSRGIGVRARAGVASEARWLASTGQWLEDWAGRGVTLSVSLLSERGRRGAVATTNGAVRHGSGWTRARGQHDMKSHARTAPGQQPTRGLGWRLSGTNGVGFPQPWPTTGTCARWCAAKIGKRGGSHWPMGHHWRMGRFSGSGRVGGSGPRRKKNFEFLYSISNQHRSQKKFRRNT